jgi:hypothetical protein
MTCLGSTTTFASCVLAAVTVLGHGTTAAAQGHAPRLDVAPAAPAAAAAPARSGIFGGLSIGRGSIGIECDRCQNVATITEALSLSAHVGWMLNPSLAVVGEHWTVRYNDRGSEWFDDSAEHLIAQRISTVGGQLWVAPTLWVRAGLGVGKHISDSHYTKSLPPPSGVRASSVGEELEAPGDWTGAAAAAIGYEFAHTPRFAAEVILRVGTTRRPSDEFQIHNTAITFGASWY